MSKITYVYCFSKNLAVDEEQYNINLFLLKESIKLLKKHYSYRIVTDKDTYLDLVGLCNILQVVDTSSFNFLDDFKISMLSKLEENEILVDPDIFVYKEIKFNTDTDIIFEFKDKPNRYWYQDDIKDIKGTLLYEKIMSIENIPFVPNIGFLKISNPTLLSNYKKLYEYYKKDLFEKLDFNFPRFSILLGQYLLGILLYEGNYSYIDIKSANTGKVYEHLSGPNKYRKYMSNKPLI